MKIGILTQPLRNNYGGLLQNYALQRVLTTMGHSPKTFDYQWKRQIDTIEMLKRHIKDCVKFLLGNRTVRHYKPTKAELDFIHSNVNAFVQNYIAKTREVSFYTDFFDVFCEENFDALVVGSDQCWRPKYNTNLFSMFFDFAKDRKIKKMSYAASFGTDEWEYNQMQTEVCSSLIRQFNAVSVREVSGVKLCKDMLNVKAITVLDPTMLLRADDYIRIVESKIVSKSSGDLFTYILDPTEEIITNIDIVCKQNNMTKFTVLPKYKEEYRTKEHVKKHIDDCVYPCVESWLRAFLDAKMVIVDSFHGMVFSIIFNKPFWVVGNEGRGTARFKSILNVLGLEDRLINVDDLIRLNIGDEINWNDVNKILERERELSLAFLNENLN